MLTHATNDENEVAQAGSLLYFKAIFTGIVMRTQTIAMFLTFLIPIAGWATQNDVRELKPGAPIERELAAGETRAYQITLSSGQFLHVVVNQRNCDLIVALIGPDGQPLAESDSRWHGPEPVSLIAKVSGVYRLQVRSREKEAAAE